MPVWSMVRHMSSTGGNSPYLLCCSFPVSINQSSFIARGLQNRQGKKTTTNDSRNSMSQVHTSLSHTIGNIPR